MFTKTMMKTVAGIAAALTLMGGSSALAQTEGPANGQGRQSREGELQRGAIRLEAKGMAMPDGRQEAGRSDKSMDGPATATPQAARPGEQPDRRDTLRVPQERGTQRNPVVARAAERSHLVLVLRIDQKGVARLESATELPGDVTLSTEPKGDFLYEVRDGGRTLAVEGMTDPFQAHSYGGPEDGQKGHHHLAQAEATLVVKVPGRNLQSALDRLEVQLYKLGEGAPTPRLDAQTVEQLRQERRLIPLLTPAQESLGAQVKARGVKVDR
jgi:hypothetical protein